MENTHIRSIKMLEDELAEKNASLAEKDTLIQALEEKLKKYEA